MYILKHATNPIKLTLHEDDGKQISSINVDLTSLADLKWFVSVVKKWFDTDKVTHLHDELAPPMQSGSVKPVVERKPCPNKSSRNGAKITKIVLHYTTTRSDASTISWFANPSARVSAHYLVGNSGKLYQFVADSDKAWHCPGLNSSSIGIEISAAPGDKLKPEQLAALVPLLQWLMHEYHLDKNDITAHRFTGASTSCPGDLWTSAADLKDWVNRYV